MYSFIISLIAIVISFYSLYLTHLKKPVLKFDTDGEVNIFSERNAIGNSIKIKLNIQNAGASVGEITDLLLKVDDKYILCPESRKNRLPISIESDKYSIKEIKFNPIIENKENLSVEKFKDGDTHEYVLYARLNGRENWEEVLKRKFINNRTVLFRKCREKIINEFTE